MTVILILSAYYIPHVQAISTKLSLDLVTLATLRALTKSFLPAKQGGHFIKMENYLITGPLQKLHETFLAYCYIYIEVSNEGK